MATKDHRITIRVPLELRRRLQAAARESGGRESDLIRTAVELRLASLDSEKASTLSAWDHLNNAHLIGVVESGKGDLSTNPRHFEGFGRR